MKTVQDVLREYLDNAVYDYGVADLKGLLTGRYANYSHGVSLVRQLDDQFVDGIEDGPTRRYLDHYHAINQELNELVDHIVLALNSQGIDCIAVPSTVRDEQLDAQLRETLTYSLSHKMVGTRAGLGWIGKTDLFVSSRFGPRVRLASLLINAPLEVGTPIDASRCGDCNVCVDQCPAAAGNGKAWYAGIAREAFFDAFRCRDYCRKISLERLNQHISLCGKCVCVCPLGQS